MQPRKYISLSTRAAFSPRNYLGIFSLLLLVVFLVFSLTAMAESPAPKTTPPAAKGGDPGTGKGKHEGPHHKKGHHWRNPAYGSTAQAIDGFNNAMRNASLNPMDAWRRMELANAATALSRSAAKLSAESRNGDLSPGETQELKTSLAKMVDINAAQSKESRDLLAQVLKNDLGGDLDAKPSSGNERSNSNPDSTTESGSTESPASPQIEAATPAQLPGEVVNLAQIPKQISETTNGGESPASATMPAAGVPSPGGLTGLVLETRILNENSPNKEKLEHEESKPDSKRTGASLVPADAETPVTVSAGSEDRSEGEGDWVAPLADLVPFASPKSPFSFTSEETFDPTLLSESDREALRREQGEAGPARYLAGGNLFRTKSRTKLTGASTDEIRIPWTKVLWIFSLFVNLALLCVKLYPLIQRWRQPATAAVALDSDDLPPSA